jgi:hypothetical protein
MRIPTSLLDATRSRFWRTAPTPPVRMVQPAVDGVDEPATPAAEPTLYVPPSHTAPAPPRTLPPGDLLLAALDACSDDAQRAALLAAASLQAREQLPGALAYQEMSTLRGRNPPLGALVAALDGCADESARAALLATTRPALLVELAEHLRHDKCDVIAQRYMDMLEPARHAFA